MTARSSLSYGLRRIGKRERHGGSTLREEKGFAAHWLIIQTKRRPPIRRTSRGVGCARTEVPSRWFQVRVTKRNGAR